MNLYMQAAARREEESDEREGTDEE